MEIKDAIKYKHELEEKLSDIIAQYITEFSANTGLTPGGVYVTLTDIREMELNNPLGFIANVSIGIVL